MGDQRDDDFTSFVVQHGAVLLRSACLMTGDRQMGEDLVQTSLAKAYRSWSRVSRAREPVAYVRRIMVNCHLSRLRRLMAREEVVEALPDRGADDSQAGFADSDEMRRALLTLSPRVRTALVLRFFEDLSEAETARMMGCSVSTVNNHVAKGIAALRVVLSQETAGPHGRAR